MGDEREAGFPRLYAAASLKPAGMVWSTWGGHSFSAALCRGLIEAHASTGIETSKLPGFPRLYAAASLKQLDEPLGRLSGLLVFRGFMPRPH